MVKTNFSLTDQFIDGQISVSRVELRIEMKRIDGVSNSSLYINSIFSQILLYTKKYEIHFVMLHIIRPFCIIEYWNEY